MATKKTDLGRFVDFFNRMGVPWEKVEDLYLGDETDETNGNDKKIFILKTGSGEFWFSREDQDAEGFLGIVDQDFAFVPKQKSKEVT